MSVRLWRWTEECDGRLCPPAGCDGCSFIPRTKGKWIDFKCSECGFEPLIKPIGIDYTQAEPRLKSTYNYCPNCGAEMESE